MHPCPQSTRWHWDLPGKGIQALAAWWVVLGCGVGRGRCLVLGPFGQWKAPLGLGIGSFALPRPAARRHRAPPGPGPSQRLFPHSLRSSKHPTLPRVPPQLRATRLAPETSQATVLAPRPALLPPLARSEVAGWAHLPGASPPSGTSGSGRRDSACAASCRSCSSGSRCTCSACCSAPCA